MTRFVARLMIVLIPLLVWVSAGVSKVAAVGSIPILVVVNELGAQSVRQLPWRDLARRGTELI